MSDEVVASNETTEATQAQLDAALESGFASVRGEEPPAPQTEHAAAAAASDANNDGEPSSPDGTNNAATQDATIEQAKQLIAGLTEDQLKAVLGDVPTLRDRVANTEGQLQKVFGKFGEVNRALATIAKGGTSAPVKVEAGQLKRTKELFDELAQPLADDLQDILSNVPRASVIAPDLGSEIEQRVSGGLQGVLRTVHELFLQQTHPDWKDLVQTADFRLWLETKPANERAMIRDSEDAAFLTPKFTEFKKWHTRNTQQRDANAKRLESAVTPKGNPSLAQPTQSNDIDAAFAAGFRSVRPAA